MNVTTALLLLATILIGIVGAVVGGYLWTAIFGNDQEGVAWIGSILVAMGLLFLYRKMTVGRRSTIT